MPVTGARKDMFRVSLSIDGEDWGVWDSRTGGKRAANGTTFKPGNMGPQRSLGGTPSVDTITLARNFVLEVDQPRFARLMAKVGNGRCVCKQLALDPDGNAFGQPIVWTGSLESADAPEHDSNSGDAAMLTVEINPDGNVTA